MTIQLSSELVAEVEPLLEGSGVDLNTFVHRVVEAYVVVLRRRQTQERLAHDYDELAAMYDELAEELADEIWLPLENEALFHTMRDVTA